jgi:hypothetical protein
VGQVLLTEVTDNAFKSYRVGSHFWDLVIFHCVKLPGLNFINGSGV